MNAHLFKDSLEQHNAELTTMLPPIAANYRDSLPPLEREFYDRLELTEQDAFRICRDVALYTGEGALPPPEFFLSCELLGTKTNRHDTQASRLLETLQQFEIVGIVERGTKRARGLPGKSKRYRWLLPLPLAFTAK